MRRSVLWLLLAALLCPSCDDDLPPEVEPMLVVEGYIDSGEFPVVMVTTTVPVSTEEQTSDSLANYMLRWAVVTIDDGEESVILTGMADERYTPPYIYTTGRMRGVAGRTYHLTVDFGRYHAEATTTIPPVPQVDYVRIDSCEVDSLCTIVVGFTDPPGERNYYKAFVRYPAEGPQWYSSPWAIVDDAVIDGATEVTLSPPRRALAGTGRYVPYFRRAGTVTIKFAQIDAAAYDYWRDYEDYTSFATNPLFPVAQNLRSNVTGGLGCWYGCGCVKRTIFLSSGFSF